MATKKGKYEVWLQKRKLNQLTGWARSGLDDRQIAKNIGINAATLYTWKKKYPQIAEALSKGKEVSDFEVENALFKSACGYYVEEEKEVLARTNEGTFEVREKHKTKKYIAPNVTAQLFWLKNRKNEVWRDVIEQKITDSSMTIKMDEEIKEFIQ